MVKKTVKAIQSGIKEPKVNQPTDAVNETRRQFVKCARKLQNWGPQHSIAPEYVFTKKEFNPNKLLEVLPIASPKIKILLETIDKLDNNDRQHKGDLFKHFIFSDIDEGGYGARMVISALIAAGYKNMMSDMQTIASPTTDPDRKTFVFLSSKPVEYRGKEYTVDGYVQAFDTSGRKLMIDADKNVGLTGEKPYKPSMKKYITSSFNAATNNHGQHIRFIVLDKKFKEGLDLYDVKYSHLLEAMSPSEEKQAMGRGTRNCGQKNLKFKTGEGWNLHVYRYLLMLPEEFAVGHDWSREYEKMITKYSDNDDRTETLTNQFTNLAEVSAIDRALSAALRIQLIKRDIAGGGTEPLQLCDAAMTQIPQKSEFCKMNESDRTNAYTELSRKVNPANNSACPAISTSLYESLTALHDCKSDEFANDRQEASPIYNTWNSAKNATSRAWNGLKETKGELADTTIELADLAYGAWNGAKTQTSRAWNGTKNAFTRKSLPDTSGPAEVHVSPERGEPNEPSEDLYNIKGYEADVIPQPEWVEELEEIIPPITDEHLAALNVDLTEFQKSVARTYGHVNLKAVNLGSLPTESACDQQKPILKEGEEPPVTNRKAATLNKTQDFLRRYITPNMITKGMLLWHSTGAGKTCTAAAIASNFEDAGYLVIYVCPTNLRSEIKKNVWEDLICHGKNVRDHKGRLQDIDSNYDPSWLGGPMAYKTFTNLVSVLNGGGGPSNAVIKEKLFNFDAAHSQTKERANDPFYKTLLIIDEAQKVYSGELPTTEAPHMPTVEAMVHKSYALHDKDSTYPCVRVVLMSATPISKDPFELFKILNLIRPKSDALPVTDAEFKQPSRGFVDSTGATNNALIAEKMAGYISYLDLSLNKTRFATKVIHDIRVPITGTADPVLPSFNRKALEQTKKQLVETKMASCKATKPACSKMIKSDGEISAIDAQLKANKPATKKKAYDKKTDFTQMGALQECASKMDFPKLDFYPSGTKHGEFAGYKFQKGNRGVGYYNISAPEPSAKVAEMIVESATDVATQLEQSIGEGTIVGRNFVSSKINGGEFVGWTHRPGSKGVGYYTTDFKDESFVPSNNDRGSITGWAYRKGIAGLGYYKTKAVEMAQTIGRAIGDRVGKQFGYTRKGGHRRRRLTRKHKFI